MWKYMYLLYSIWLYMYLLYSIWLYLAKEEPEPGLQRIFPREVLIILSLPMSTLNSSHNKSF